ncbi:MAG: hypothetical protein ACRDH9_06150 [Actinomycetota bacterium]
MTSTRTPMALAAIVGVLMLPGAPSAARTSPTVSPGSPAGEVFQMIASSLETLGATEAMVDAAREPEVGEREYPYVVPAGDLDDDGLPDVVTVTSIPDAVGVTSEIVLTARRGLDGTVLWTLPTGTTGLSAAVPATVGQGADHGLLLVSYRASLLVGAVGGTHTAEGFYGFFGTGANVSAEVLAISGAGQELWRYQSPVGHFVYPPVAAVAEPLVAENVPVVGGTLDATSSPATDVLVALYDRAPTAEGQDDRVRTIVIDGADGSESSTAITDITGARTSVAPAPDLDGDGLHDYTVLVDAVTEEAVSGIRARRSTDGALLWTSPRDVNWLQHRPKWPGDVTGDGIGDLVLDDFGTPPGPYNEAMGTGKVALLDGATGTQAWEVAADTARTLGDVTGDGRAEVLVATSFRRQAVVGLRYEALTDEGSAWAVEFPLPRQGTTQATLTFVEAGDVGDDGGPEDGDGVPDFAHHLRLLDSSGELVREDARVIDGRTGETLRSSPLGGTPLRASVDGAGDDVALVEAWGPSVRDVSTLDGLSGTELWRARLRARGATRVTGFQVWARDLDGDQRAEIIATAASITTTLTVPQGVERNERFVDAWVLSGADGSLLWHSDPLVVPETAEVDGVVRPGQPFEWDGTQATGAYVVWQLSADCGSSGAPYRCDRLLLQLSNPPDPGEGTRTATATVEIGEFAPMPAPGSDFDLYVYESDGFGTEGALIDESAGIDPVERVQFPLTTTEAAPSGYVLVEVLYYQSVESGYTGKASLETG